MFDALKKLFQEMTRSEAEHHFDDDDHRLAAAALLVHVTAVDGVEDDAERSKLREVLMRGYDMSERDVDELIEEARQKDAEAVDLYGFTSVLKRTLDEEGRQRVVEMMWQMVYADGDVHEFEDNLVWRSAELLGVSSRDRIRIRKSVENRASGE